MSATIYPLVFEKGSQFTLDLIWQDSSGTPVNLTGYAAKMEVFQDPNYYTAVIKASSLGDGTANTTLTLGGSAGSISVIIDVGALALLTDGQRTTYGLTLLSGGGVYTRLFEGPVTLKPLVVEW